MSSAFSCRALRAFQTDFEVYLFCLPASKLLQVASLSPLQRNANGELEGYQRPAIRRHIQEIADYLSGDQVLFPNNLILALKPCVTFRPDRRSKPEHGVTHGRLFFPDSPDPVAWIVDGQQRALALRQSDQKLLPVPVSAFISDSIHLQRDQFLRINNARKLPRDLLHELLPAVETPLPDRLQFRRIPSLLCDWLNSRPESPFYGLIRRASTARSERRQKPVKDTALLLAIEESITRPSGSLFTYVNLGTGEADLEGMYEELKSYWNAVREVFPEAWGLPSRKSRLMHGVGIRAMGHFMDRLARKAPREIQKRHAYYRKALLDIAPACRWTEGFWEDLNLAWNALQNTPQHIRMLSHWLDTHYLQL